MPDAPGQPPGRVSARNTCPPPAYQQGALLIPIMLLCKSIGAINFCCIRAVFLIFIYLDIGREEIIEPRKTNKEMHQLTIC
jgi:hypothetical protein